MKNKINYTAISIYTLILSFIIIGISCEKTIEIDLEDAKIKIVVNGIINPDSTIKVNVTRSRHILDNADIESLTDANVKLYEDGNLIGNMTHTGGGNYHIDYKPVENKEYKVEVSHEKYDNVQGLTRIVPSIPIIRIDTTTTFDEYGSPVLDFKIRFSDPADEKNYYLLKLSNTFLYEEWDESLITYDTTVNEQGETIVYVNQGGLTYTLSTEDIWIDSDDLIIEEHMWSSGVIFSDEIINGENYSFTGKLHKGSLYQRENKITFELHSLSPEAYKYYKSVHQHYYNSGDPFAEPVIVFTNITDGIGIFGSSSVYKDSIIVERVESEFYDIY